ncbi:MAG: DUF2333 family protein [Gammaproteobacteria bacterium]|nr:DUF2333 family protein [Gammaproteobacteria bacterium]
MATSSRPSASAACCAARSRRHRCPEARAAGSAHRHELFGAGRVDGDRVVEVALGRAHLHRHREPLQHLVGAGADHVAAHDALLRPDRHQLHGGARLARRERVVHRHETRVVDLHLRGAVALDGRGFRKADRADRRVAEHHGRDVRVVEVAAFHAAEDAVGEPTAGGDGDRRELGLSRDIADRVDAADVGLLEAVDGDEARSVELHAGAVEADALDDGFAADGPQHGIVGPGDATVLQQVIRELEEAQAPLGSPVVLNGSSFGLFANHSLVLANYLSRANATIIELRALLERG